MYNSIIEAVCEHAKNKPDTIAVFDANVSYTYAELFEASKKAACNIKNICGVKKGDYVVVECTQAARHMVLCMACQMLEVVFVPFEKGATVDRVESMYKETESKVLITENDYSAVDSSYAIADLMAEPDEKLYSEFTYNFPETESVAEILFSTGTTGKPKGIMISHRADVACAENVMVGSKFEDDAVELVPLYISHAHGIRTCYACFVKGCTLGVMDGVTNVGLFFKMIEEHNVTALDLSPTLGKMLVKIAKRGLIKISEQIKYIELGTAVLDDELKNDLKALFPNSRLYNFYGSTEAGRCCVYDFNKEDYTVCIGYPACHAQFMIVDENRNIIKATAENPGLVAISGDMLMSGYFKSPELSAQTVVDGVLYTSDLGYIDDDGRVYVFGRADDVINYKGIKIAPEEIEVPASEYPGIKDLGCIAMEDKLCGFVPKLFISVESEDFDKAAFIAFLKERLDVMRVPASVEIIDEIPRSSNGKLLRKKLREM